MPDNILALLLLGLVAGLLSGMFGIGGGAIIVPALTIIMSYPLHEALGTSLAVLIWPVSIFAVIAYYRANLINIRVAVLIAVGLLLGGYVGAQLALWLPVDVLQRVYGIFLIYAGWRFVEPRKLYRKWRASQAPAANPAVETSAVETSAAETADEDVTAEAEQSWYVVLAVGLLAGVASGLFGIGGGLVIVPALVGILHYNQKRAVGTSLAALLPPVGIGAVVSYYQAGYIQIPAALAVAAGLVVGAFGGARIALGLPSATVKRLYGVFLIVVSLRFIFQF